MEELLIGLVTFALGAWGGRWHARRPRKAKRENRDAGLARYQAMKNGS